MPWIKSRRISQSSRASPGGWMARLSRWSRPVLLIIEPRFSAKPAPGSTTCASFVVALGRMFIATINFAFAISGPSTSVASSPSTMSAFTRLVFSPLEISARRDPGSAEVTPSSLAPAVFGLRSVLSKISSPSPVRGTISTRRLRKASASRLVRNNSSLVIRPDAMIAISNPANFFNSSAAREIATSHVVIACPAALRKAGAVSRSERCR